MKDNSQTNYSGRGTILLLRVMGLDSIIVRYSSELVFSDLAQIETLISSEVQKHGGLLAGNLKNGALAFFGWNSNQSSEPLEHVAEAFHCAIDVQKKSAEILQADTRRQHPMFPLQIAVVSDLFHIHCLENYQHAGIVGRGVQLAQRIVEYCGIKSIIMDSETHRVLEHLGHELGSRHEIRVRLEGSSKVISAFEHNVFGNEQDVYSTITDRVQISFNRRNEERRWRCSRDEVDVKIEEDSYTLLNISRGGVEVEGEVPHLHGEIVKINFSNTEGILQVCTQKLGLADIECEVRWNRRSGHCYRLGLRFNHLNDVEREELVSLIISNTNSKLAV